MEVSLSRAVHGTKMWLPSQLLKSSRVTLPPRGPQQKGLENTHVVPDIMIQKCSKNLSPILLNLLVMCSSDGCVLPGDDSLLVRWLSSTSKPGTFPSLLTQNSFFHILSTYPSCCYLFPLSRSRWALSWRVCCWACARMWRWRGLTCCLCWRPVSFTTRPPYCPLLTGSSGSW